MREVGSQLLFTIFFGKNLLRQSDIRKTKICFNNFAASDNYTSALSQDSHRCIGLNVYERSKKIFLEDRKINVCQLNWPAGCCFQQNIGDIDL